MHLSQPTVTRFVAALGIVVYHLGRTTWPFSLVPHLVNLLHLSVSYFFTLSGFILVISQMRQGGLPAQVAAVPFWRNRFARIYPLYSLALGLWIAFNLISSHPQGLLEPIGMGLSLLLLQSWVPAYALYGNFPAWSLSVEAFFYLIFPSNYRLYRGFPLWQLVLAALATLAVMLGASWFFIHTQANHSYYSYQPYLHAGSFLVGMAGGFLFIQHSSSMLPFRHLLRAGAVAGLVAALYGLLANPAAVAYAHNGALAPLFVLGIIGLSLSGRARPLLSRGPLPWLGEISYGIYILHTPVSLFAYSVAARLGGLVGLDAFWFHVLILLAASAATYRWVEVPARNWLRGRKVAQPVG